MKETYIQAIERLIDRIEKREVNQSINEVPATDKQDVICKHTMGPFTLKL